MARMTERVRALEAENMGNKDWFMRGETSAGVLACAQRLFVTQICADRRQEDAASEESVKSLRFSGQLLRCGFRR